MRSIACWLLGVAGVFTVCAQEIQTTQPTDSHESVVSKMVQIQRSDGRVASVKSSYVQIEDGLNYWNEESGQWESSVEEIEIVASGAVALRGQHRAIFSSNANDAAGALDLEIRGAVRLRSSVLALQYYDPATGKSALLATIQDTQGELLPPNQVIYRSAFEGLKADVLYTYRKAGVESDIILREIPPSPADFGLNPETSRLEAITEFFQPPAPAKKSTILAQVDDPVVRKAVAEPDWVDEELDFGANKIGLGRAFAWSSRDAAKANPEQFAPVGKRWEVTADGRTVLIESVELQGVIDDLLTLPGTAQRQEQHRESMRAWAAKGDSRSFDAAAKRWASRQSNTPQKSASLILPSRKLRASNGNDKNAKIQLASAPEPARPGLVLDWISLVGAITNYTLKGDETYYVTGDTTLAGTTTLDAGAVIKYPRTNTSSQIWITGTFVSNTKPYLPAIFTAEDDNTVGSLVTAGSPSATDFYGAVALRFKSAPSNTVVQHIHSRFVRQPIYFDGDSPDSTVRHCQFVNTTWTLAVNSNRTVRVQNVLIDGIKTNGAVFCGVATGTNGQFICENVTVANGPYLYSQATVKMTNSIVAGITMPGSYTGAGNAQYSSTSGVFQAVGAGNFYLSISSTNRNVGVTNLTPSLTAALKTLTTRAPQLLTTDFTVDTTLSTTADRDTDTPDRGYHYPPLDYCLSALAITNATVSLTNGVGIGLYGIEGFRLGGNGNLSSEGSPSRMNHLVRYTAIQEQAISWGTTGATFDVLKIVSTNATGTVVPTASFRFTEILHPAVAATNSDGRKLLTSIGTIPLRFLAMQDCFVAGLKLDFQPSSLGPQAVYLTNNVFTRGAVAFGDNAGGPQIAVNLYNNLLLNTYDWLANNDTNSWVFKDNLFASAALTTTGTVNFANNGFRSGLIGLGTATKTNLSLDFVGGPLGIYYYPTNGSATSLTNLVNTGSRSATNATLYHYTTRADNIKEGATTVDIGFHYVAVDANGEPLDGDGDGLPDYFEDRNGNGTSDAGETDWQTSNSGFGASSNLLLFTPTK